MDVWQEEVRIDVNRIDLAIQKLMAEGSPAMCHEAPQVTQSLRELLRGLKLDRAAVEKARVCQSEGQAIRPEDVLIHRELDLLAKAENAELPCPFCDQPLHGEFVYLQVADDDYYAGVKLSCCCGFVEY